MFTPLQSVADETTGSVLRGPESADQHAQARPAHQCGSTQLETMRHVTFTLVC